MIAHKCSKPASSRASAGTRTQSQRDVGNHQTVAGLTRAGALDIILLAMSLKTQLQDDLKVAMRHNDALRKDVLRLTIAAVKNAEIAKIGELTEDETLAVLRTEVKRRRETIAEVEQAGRVDLLAQEQAQLEVLSAYLPQQMSREQIAEAARTVLAQMDTPDPKPMGLVMKQLMAELKGKADGRLVQEVVRELMK